MKARISAIVVCVSSWLLAGSALAAGPFASVGKNPAPQFRPADRDFVQSTSAIPTRFLRENVGAHRRPVNRRDFPASPPSDSVPAIDMLMPLTGMTSRPFVDNRQSTPFRFDRHGGAVVREVSRGYNHMCDSLSGRVWNEPGGKRICFDTRGKPGIAIRIPIN